MRHDDLPDDLNRITGIIVDAALTVHRELGPGLLERVYHDALCAELVFRDRKVESGVSVPPNLS